MKEDVVEKSRKEDMVGKSWPVWSVAFSPDGRCLAAGRGYRDSGISQFVGDGEVNVWGTEDWKRRDGFIASFSFWVDAVAFTPDGKHLIAAADRYFRRSSRPESDDPSIGGGFERRQRQAGTIPPPNQEGNNLAFWKVSDGELVKDWPIKASGHNDFLRSLAVSPDGDLIALGREGGVLIVQMKSGHLLYDLKGTSMGIAFSPDGKTLASVAESKPSIRLYSPASGKELASFELEVANPVHVRFGEQGYERAGDWSTCVGFSPDGKQIAVGVTDGSVRLLAADLTKQLRTIKVSDRAKKVQVLAYATKADLLAAATTTRVRLFEASSGKQLQEWGKDELEVWSLALSPDGKLLAVGYGGKHEIAGESRGGYVKVWDTATGKLVKKLD